MLRGGAPLYIVRMVDYMMIENALMKFGFIKEDNNSRLIEMIKNKTNLKEVHIDTYPENPLSCSSSNTLLLRTTEKNASVLIEGGRLIFKKNDAYETLFVNVLISKIKECFFKMSDDYSELILNVQNIYYRITIIN